MVSVMLEPPASIAGCDRGQRLTDGFDDLLLRARLGAPHKFLHLGPTCLHGVEVWRVRGQELEKGAFCLKSCSCRRAAVRPQDIDQHHVARPDQRDKLRPDIGREHLPVGASADDKGSDWAGYPQADCQGEIPSGVERHGAVGALPTRRPREGGRHGAIEAELIREDEPVAGDAFSPPTECLPLLKDIRSIALCRVKVFFFA